jgi:L-aspartate oxidase
MGGVATDTFGRTTLPGLFAVGEVACTGAHGANRLASNSLLEGLVFAHRAAGAIGETGPEGQHWPAPPAWLDAPARIPAAEESAAARPVDRSGLQSLLWESVGVHRDGARLRSALGTLNGWRASGSERPGRREREDANLLELARLVVTAALGRGESRGAHFRSDHPLTAPGVPDHTVLVAAVPAEARTSEASVAC